MKKTKFVHISFFILFFFLLSFPSLSLACEKISGVKYPEPLEVLKKDNTTLGIYQIKEILKQGKRARAELFLGQKESPTEVFFFLDDFPCLDKIDQFHINDFYVAIFDKNLKDIPLHQFDEIFVYPFSAGERTQAFAKYDELLQNFSQENLNVSFSKNPMKIAYPNAEEVRLLQRMLKKVLNLDENFVVDGVFGTKTLNAVKTFQEKYALKKDGIVGAKTKEKLINVFKNLQAEKTSEKEVAQSFETYTLTSKTLKPGMKGDEVKKMQYALKSILALSDDFKIDGSYGPQTIAAIKALQKKYHLKVDGIAGPKTQKLMLGVRIPLLDMKNQTEAMSPADNEKEAIQEEKEEKQKQTRTENNNDIIDQKLKSLMQKAQKVLTQYKQKGKNYTEAYALVVRFNNDFLKVVDSSDPLYKSFDNGQKFVYLVNLKNGKYYCADENQVIEINFVDDIQKLQGSCTL